MKKSKLIIVTGFLGSGKTSFLKFLLGRYSGKYKLAIIQNEFSGSNIDAFELKNSKWKFELVEINNGSVFCICQFSNFTEQLNILKSTYNPDYIILEVTGLADPMAIGAIFNNNSDFYLSKIVTVVDAVNYIVARKAIMAVDNQIRVADLVLINKSDLIKNVSELEQIQNFIFELNPSVTIVTTYHSGYSDFTIEDENELKLRQSGNLSQPNPNIISEVFKTTNSMTKRELDSFILSLPDNLIRMKGYIKLENNKSCFVQYVMGKSDLLFSDNPVSGTELIKISFRQIIQT